MAVGGSGDGSELDPYGSIGAAVADPRFGPGASVRVHAGTYGGGLYLADLRGTVEAPVWIGGAPGEATPVFDGGTQAMHLVKAAYLVLHDV